MSQILNNDLTIKIRMVKNYGRRFSAVMAESRQELVAAMRQAGRRITVQRRAVLEYLADRSDHPSAGQIYRDLAPRVASLSLATVYNTLTALVEMGLLREIEFAVADNRYDTNLTPHINLVCVRCDSITDLDQPLPVSTEDIEARLGFKAVEFRIEYRGLCSRCRAAPHD